MTKQTIKSSPLSSPNTNDVEVEIIQDDDYVGATVKIGAYSFDAHDFIELAGLISYLIKD